MLTLVSLMGCVNDKLAMYISRGWRFNTFLISLRRSDYILRCRVISYSLNPFAGAIFIDIHLQHRATYGEM